MIGHAIDVSHHQPVGSVPFARIAADRPTKDWKTACIVRATYGTKRDRLVTQHFDAARVVFDHVGLYHFYRLTDWALDQIEAFTAVAREVYLGAPTDLVPIIDVEDDGKGLAPSKSWVGGLQIAVQQLTSAFDVRPMIYSTDRVFKLLGSPAWMLTYPWWGAHYTTAAEPSAPAGCDLRMWQHRVGVYDGPQARGGYYETGPRLDQNRILARLPTFGDPS